MSLPNLSSLARAHLAVGRTSLAVILASGLVMSSVPAAYADAFDASSGDIARRLAALEERLRDLQPAVAPAAAPAPGDLSLPPPPPEPAGPAGALDAPLTYTLLAEINGHFLVRDGDVRRLLDADAYQHFKAQHLLKAQKAALAESAAAAAAPTPPPNTSPSPSAAARPVSRAPARK